MYQSIPDLTIPLAPPSKIPGATFLSSPPLGKKEVQNPDPRAYKNELKPHPGHFPQLFIIKTWKNETETM